MKQILSVCGGNNSYGTSSSSERCSAPILLTSGKLYGCLAGIDKQAGDMLFRLVEQMACCENITERLKAENDMLWVGKMNEMQARAREIVYAEIIYVT